MGLFAFAFVSIAGIRAVNAEPITITSGFFFYHVSSAAGLVVSQPIMVHIDIGSDSGHLPPWACFDCPPGRVVNTSTTEHLVPSSGVFTIGSRQFFLTRVDLRIHGGDIRVPATIDEADFVGVAAPFTFESVFSGTSEENGLSRTIELFGRGTMGVTFHGGDSPGTSSFVEAGYSFDSPAPVPEPPPLLLIAASLVAVSVFFGRSRQVL